MVVIDPIHKDGELVGFAKVTRDMTEQREANDAALESERRFRLLVAGRHRLRHLHARPGGTRHQLERRGRAHQGLRARTRSSASTSPASTRPRMPRRQSPRRALETARREGRYEAEGWRVRKDGSRSGPAS